MNLHGKYILYTDVVLWYYITYLIVITEICVIALGCHYLLAGLGWVGTMVVILVFMHL